MRFSKCLAQHWLVTVDSHGLEMIGKLLHACLPLPGFPLYNQHGCPLTARPDYATHSCRLLT